MQTAALLSTLVLVWCVAVLIKIHASGSQPYELRQWDGGLLLRGTTIGRTGKTVLGVFSVVLGAVAAWQLVRVAAYL